MRLFSFQISGLQWNACRKLWFICFRQTVRWHAGEIRIRNIIVKNKNHHSEAPTLLLKKDNVPGKVIFRRLIPIIIIIIIILFLLQKRSNRYYQTSSITTSIHAQHLRTQGNTAGLSLTSYRVQSTNCFFLACLKDNDNFARPRKFRARQ